MINNDRTNTAGYKIGYYFIAPLASILTIAGIIRLTTWIITGG